MSNFDPTKNRTPTGLLTLDEKSALMSWPHGFEFYNEVERVWEPITPTWGENFIYRGKPAPSVETYFCDVYDPLCFFGWHDNYDDAVRLAGSKNIGIVRIKIVDGKLKDARVAEGDEK